MKRFLLLLALLLAVGANAQPIIPANQYTTLFMTNVNAASARGYLGITGSTNILVALNAGTNVTIQTNGAGDFTVNSSDGGGAFIANNNGFGTNLTFSGANTNTGTWTNVGNISSGNHILSRSGFEVLWRDSHEQYLFTNGMYFEAGLEQQVVGDSKLSETAELLALWNDPGGASAGNGLLIDETNNIHFRQSPGSVGSIYYPARAAYFTNGDSGSFFYTNGRPAVYLTQTNPVASGNMSVQSNLVLGGGVTISNGGTLTGVFSGAGNSHLTNFTGLAGTNLTISGRSAIFANGINITGGGVTNASGFYSGTSFLYQQFTGSNLELSAPGLTFLLRSSPAGYVFGTAGVPAHFGGSVGATSVVATNSVAVGTSNVTWTASTTRPPGNISAPPGSLHAQLSNNVTWLWLKGTNAGTDGWQLLAQPTP